MFKTRNRASWLTRIDILNEIPCKSKGLIMFYFYYYYWIDTFEFILKKWDLNLIEIPNVVGLIPVIFGYFLTHLQQ